MTKLWYFLSIVAESGLSVFGVRSPYEQPAYQVVQSISPSIEMRRYEARLAVETPLVPGNEGAAFGTLFRYITGANQGRHLMAMTAPVLEAPGKTMRFILPQSVAAKGAPAPTGTDAHLVMMPAQTLCVIRFSGAASSATREAETVLLRTGLARAGKSVLGEPINLSYDPPFTIPFLRRNEVAIPCS